MGRRNKAYSKDLHQQAYDRLTGMQVFGESKKKLWPMAQRKKRFFLSTPIRAIGNTRNILSSTSRKSTRNALPLKAQKSMPMSGCRAEWIRACLHGRYSWRRRRWESYTGSHLTTKIILSRQSVTGRTLRGAAGIECVTGIFPRRTMTS